MKLYCLSGLGVDKRVFVNIQHPDLELVHIEWIPHKEAESLQDYAIRLFDSVQPEQHYSLLGLSFGGMVAAEFAKIKRPQNLFYLSTISGKEQLPRYVRFFVSLRMYRFLPSYFLKRPNRITYYLFGIKTKEHRELLKIILSETDSAYLRWAIGAIGAWKIDKRPEGHVIHGDSDYLLPINGKVDCLIQNGGHFSVLENGEKISEFIARKIN